MLTAYKLRLIYCHGDSLDSSLSHSFGDVWEDAKMAITHPEHEECLQRVEIRKVLGWRYAVDRLFGHCFHGKRWTERLFAPDGEIVDSCDLSQCRTFFVDNG